MNNLIIYDFNNKFSAEKLRELADQMDKENVKHLILEVERDKWDNYEYTGGVILEFK